MRQFRLPDVPPDPDMLYVLLDLPLLIAFNDDEFDKVADMKAGDELEISDYRIKRVS